jgi:hypothetical protein
LPIKSNYEYKIDRAYTNPINISMKKGGKTSFIVGNFILKMLRIRSGDKK